MTDKEKAIVMAHTGICMLTGDKFQIFHKYVEDIMRRPIMTHEMGWLADSIKEKSKADFIALCAEQVPILDKIRAEIKLLSNSNPSYWHSGDMVDRDDVLEIIDKYKAESEG